MQEQYSGPKAPVDVSLHDPHCELTDAEYVERLVEPMLKLARKYFLEDKIYLGHHVIQDLSGALWVRKQVVFHGH